MKLRPSFVVLGSALLALAQSGCDSVSNTPDRTATLNALATVKNANVPLAFDDPIPVFKAVFPDDFLPLKKDPLETQAEFNARIGATGVVGKEYVFLISPAHCEVEPFPEQSFYVIKSKDSFYNGYSRIAKPYGVTVATVHKPKDTYVGQNAYGASATITAYRGVTYKLHFENLLKEAFIVRWTKSSGFVNFGLPVKIEDPAFRQLLREEKIGLAVRVRIGDVTKADSDLLSSTATITNPTSLHYTIPILPATLLEAWVVDTTTNISVVSWKAAAN